MADMEAEHTVTDPRPTCREDEVELIDILRTLWKRKRFIFIGTLLCVLVTAGISFLLPKIYRVDMVIRPGVIGENENYQDIYIDSEGDIKAIIEAGTFDQRILKALSAAYPKNTVRKIDWLVTSLHGSNTLKISYDTSSTDQGFFVLNTLYQNLVTYYQPVVEKYRKKYQLEIQEVKNDILNKQAEIASQKAQLANNRQRVREIDKEIARVSGNTNDLISERNLFLKARSTDDKALSALIYSNTVQQNIGFLNTLKSQKTTLLNTLSDEKVALERSEHDVKMYRKKIDNIEFNANAVQNIQKLQPPVRSSQPISPRNGRNTALAFILGLLAMMFASLFMEYIRLALMREGKR